MFPPGLPHTPLASHVVRSVHAFASSHLAPAFAGLPPRHLPFEHASPAVQRFLSSHFAPSLPGTATHVWVASSHVPIMQTSPGAAHGLGAPLHVPLVQTSLIVQ